jgi:hypothetical protein
MVATCTQQVDARDIAGEHVLEELREEDAQDLN